MRREVIGEFVAMGEPVERIPFAGSSCRERLELTRWLGPRTWFSDLALGLGSPRLATFRLIPDMTDEPIPPREFRAMKGVPFPAVRAKDRSINVHLLEPPK
jgi:hypothetical protein